MNKPTEAQIKEFWTFCGLIEQPTGSWYVDEVLGEYVSSNLPVIDLNNLFKYAVPKLDKPQIALRYAKNMSEFYCSIYLNSEPWVIDAFGETYELALFWATWEIIQAEKSLGVLTNKG